MCTYFTPRALYTFLTSMTDRRPTSHLGKFRMAMAILQRVILSTSVFGSRVRNIGENNARGIMRLVTV